MITLTGIHINELVVPTEIFVGVLFFAEYPTTQIYADTNGTPIIKEWVDCSDDGTTDRYFYYKSSVLWLNKFINGFVSHRDLILNATDGLVCFQDELIEDSRYDNNVLISSNNLPSQYLPSSNFFFKNKDSVNLEVIIDFFNLNDVPLSNDITDKVKEIASTKNSETFNLHFEEGNGIGFGTINTEIFGKTLIKFDKFYKNAALDHILGKNRGYTKKQKRNELSSFISTEIYHNFAASYSILIRPTQSQYNLFADTTQSEIIADNIFKLFDTSTELEKLKAEYTLHSEFTIDSFREFLESIFKLGLSLNLNWYNPVSHKEHKGRFDTNSAKSIINNFEILNIENEDEFSKIGKFRAINCDSGHYHFTSNDDEKFTGRFDKHVKEGSERISFLELYEVRIHRKTIKEAGKTEAKITDYITAFYIQE